MFATPFAKRLRATRSAPKRKRQVRSAAGDRRPRERPVVTGFFRGPVPSPGLPWTWGSHQKERVSHHWKNESEIFHHRFEG